MLFCHLWLRVGFDGWIDSLIEKGSAKAQQSGAFIQPNAPGKNFAAVNILQCTQHRTHGLFKPMPFGENIKAVAIAAD